MKKQFIRDGSTQINAIIVEITHFKRIFYIFDMKLSDFHEDIQVGYFYKILNSHYFVVPDNYKALIYENKKKIKKNKL